VPKVDRCLETINQKRNACNIHKVSALNGRIWGRSGVMTVVLYHSVFSRPKIERNITTTKYEMVFVDVAIYHWRWRPIEHSSSKFITAQPAVLYTRSLNKIPY